MHSQITSSILTASGKWFDVLNPQAALIDLADIACALSKLCRFGGHCNEFYSVAEHSIMVSRRVAQLGGDTEAILWGLLHDASEAYVVDIPRPVKRHIPQYNAIEDAIQIEVARRFNLSWPMPEVVHQADHDLLAFELRELMPVQPEEVLPPKPLLKVELARPSLPPKMAEQTFLDEARKLSLIPGAFH